MRTFLSDALSVGFSKMLIIVFGLATSIIIARHLGPEQNGIIAALLVYPSLFMSVGSLGIRQSTTYFLGKNIYSESEIKTAITQIWFFTSIISVVVCFFLITYLSKSGSNQWYVILAILPIPFSLFNTYNSGIFLGKNDISNFNKINWIPPLVILILVLILVLAFSMGISGYFLAKFGGALFVSILLLFKNKFLKAFSFKFNWNIIKSMLGLGMVYALALLVINLNYKLDVILLDNLSESYQTGIYSKGVSVTEYLWQIPMLLSTIVFARSAVSKDDRLFSLKVTQLLRVSLVLVGGATLVLFLLSKYIILLMFGPAFAESSSVLKLLLPGVFLLTIFKVVNMDLSGKGKPWVSLKAMVPALILNVILNVLLIPEYGADGASFASTLSYTIAAILFLNFYSKETNISVREIISYKKTDFEPLLRIITKLKNKA